MEVHPRDANLAVVRDHYSLPMASCTRWVQGTWPGELLQGTFSLRVYKTWPVLHVSSRQRHYTSGSAWVTETVEGEENIVQIEKSVNINMIISEFKKLFLKFHSTEFQNYF